MKKGNIMRDVISSNQFTENAIKEYKKGRMVINLCM